jgi:uncharacterized protein YqgV (UPF0045/DUF77 family)
MIKKTKKAVKKVSEMCEARECPKMDSLKIDLGRDDLNSMRDKLNEIIEKLNGN